MFENYPKESRCFICSIALAEDEQKQFGTVIQTNDGSVYAAFIVCQEDQDWIRNNKDAATAIVQSRLQAIAKDNEDNEANGAD